MPANETIELADALTNELQVPVLQLVINRVLNVLFAEKESALILETLPSQLPEGTARSAGWRSRASGASCARRSKRARSGRFAATSTSPCSELPNYDSLETTTARPSTPSARRCFNTSDAVARARTIR